MFNWLTSHEVQKETQSCNYINKEYSEHRDKQQYNKKKECHFDKY